MSEKVVSMFFKARRIGQILLGIALTLILALTAMSRFGG